MARTDAFFKLMHDRGASDLHVISGNPPILRVRATWSRSSTRSSPPSWTTPTRCGTRVLGDGDRRIPAEGGGSRF